MCKIVRTHPKSLADGNIIKEAILKLYFSFNTRQFNPKLPSRGLSNELHQSRPTSYGRMENTGQRMLEIK